MRFLVLKRALHFANVLIEGMICDDRLNSPSARASDGISYNQSESSCSFQTKFVKEYVPCPFILDSFVCSSTKQLVNVLIKTTSGFHQS